MSWLEFVLGQWDSYFFETEPNCCDIRKVDAADDDDDKNSGDQHALMLLQQQPRLGTSSKVESVKATLNFFFVKATN